MNRPWRRKSSNELQGGQWESHSWTLIAGNPKSFLGRRIIHNNSATTFRVNGKRVWPSRKENRWAQSRSLSYYLGSLSQGNHPKQWDPIKRKGDSFDLRTTLFGNYAYDLITWRVYFSGTRELAATGEGESIMCVSFQPLGLPAPWPREECLHCGNWQTLPIRAFSPPTDGLPVSTGLEDYWQYCQELPRGSDIDPKQGRFRYNGPVLFLCGTLF